MLRKTIIAMVMAALAVCAGCESQAQSRKAAKQRWEMTSAQIKLTLAEQQYEQGDYEKAAQTLQGCLAGESVNPQARVLYGKLLLASGRRYEAIEQLRAALKSDERLDEGWYWSGVAAQEERDYQEAYKHYEKALSLEPANVDYILAAAEAQVAQGNYSQAEELLTEKMAALPRDVSLKIAAADLMCRLGDSEGAIELYKRAMLMTSDDGDIAESLGYCYALSDKWDEAAEIFSRLVEQCKDEQRKKSYLEMMALCSMNCAQYSRAVSCYSRLSVDERGNAEIWMKMGQAALGAGAANRAFMCGQKALSLRPGYADAIALTGCAQYAGGNYTGAAESFEKIAADSKNAGFSWLMRARCYEQLGQIKKAERAYKKALEANPQSELASFLARGRDTQERGLEGN
jgi:tetratricopeptide (TPR) repeat protein